MPKAKTPKPTDATLAQQLGRAKSAWDKLIAQVQQSPNVATADWKHYSTGWIFVVRDKRRNLAYLRPDQKRFTASFAFNDTAVRAAELADLPADLVESIRSSPKYPEGRAARIEVSTQKHAAIAMALFDIKCAT